MPKWNRSKNILRRKLEEKNQCLRLKQLRLVQLAIAFLYQDRFRIRRPDFFCIWWLYWDFNYYPCWTAFANLWRSSRFSRTSKIFKNLYTCQKEAILIQANLGKFLMVFEMQICQKKINLNCQSRGCYGVVYK